MAQVLVNVSMDEDLKKSNDGIGKPEPLKHQNGWSRWIDDVHRLVYQLKIIFLFCPI
jgi:Txe/YoeB family toxin of Txe-Axe toxin-antitoxin module